MRKILKLSFIVLTLIGLNSSAQEMNPGTGFLGIGIGPSNSYLGYRTSTSPAIRLSYDKGYKEIGPGTLTLGGSISAFTRQYKGLAYNNADGKYYNYTWRWTYSVAAFRLGYFYNFKDLDVSELNVYAGIAAGLRFVFFNDSYNGPIGKHYAPYSQDFIESHLGMFLGANYFITSKTAIFMEFGYDVSWATMGIHINI